MSTTDAPAFPLTPRGVHRAARASGGLVYSAGSLIFLSFGIITPWLTAPVPTAIGATVLCLVYGVVFLYASGIAMFPLRVRLGWYGLTWLLLLALLPLLGANLVFFVFFQAMVTVLLLPWRAAVPTVLLVCGGTVVLAVASENYIGALLGVAALVMCWSIGQGIRTEVLREDLARAQQRNAVLAVAAERERIGRDLHDILGHSLTTVTVSAQLARRLVDTDPEGAKVQLAHIERSTRQALADVRSTASGMQHVRVAGEVAAARSVLAAAGIDAQVPTALPVLPDDRAELLGYVVREAVTNLVRHSRAEHARIEVTADGARVEDDGVGIPAHAVRTGLRGLEGRVSQAGGTLEVGPGSALAASGTGRGTTLAVTLPPEGDGGRA